MTLRHPFTVILFVLALCASAGAAWAVCGGSGSIHTLGSCAGFTEGTREYDTSNNLYKVCDGTNWVSMKGSSFLTYQPCFAGQIGLMEYDSTITNYKYCNGSYFVELANNGTDGTCAGTTAGTMNYDSTNHWQEWCNGTNWIKMQGTSGNTKCIFATSTTFTPGAATAGRFNSLTSADGRCATAASGAGLSGTYKAWMSDGSTEAYTRLTHATIPYALPDDTVVAKDWNDLVDGTMRLRIRGRIRTGENAMKTPRYSAVQGNYAYVSADGWNAVVVVDISNPSLPTIVGYLEDNTNLPSAHGIAVSGNYAYVAVDGGVTVLDISNPLMPKYHAKVTDAALNYANGAVLSGNYFYVAANGANAMTIVDISNPAAPAIAGGGTGTISDATKLGGALGIEKSGNYVYVTANGSDSVTVVDVTNPAAPAFPAGGGGGTILDATNLSNVIGIEVSGNYAYVGACPGGSGRLTVIDISTPNTPTVAASLVHNSGVVELYCGQAVSLSGTKAYITTVYGMTEVNIATPTSPTYVGQLSDSPMFQGSYGFTIVGNYAYGTGDISNALYVADLSTSPPTLAGSTAEYLNRVQGVKVVGNYAYVVSYGSSRLSVIDISNKDAPVVVGSVKDSSWLSGANKVDVSGNYAYVAAKLCNCLTVVDISTPTAPSVVGHVQDNTKLYGAFDVKVSGNYAYIAVYDGDRLTIVDISTPSSPTIPAGGGGGTITNAVLNGANHLALSGSYAYVTAENSDRIVRINIATPNTPTITNSLQRTTELNGAVGIDISGNYAFVAANAGNHFTVIDISNTAIAPVYSTTIANNTAPNNVAPNNNYLNSPYSLTISGNYAFVGGVNYANNNLTVIDISTPTSPAIKGSLMPSRPTHIDGAIYNMFASGGYLYFIGSNSGGHPGDASASFNIAEITDTHTAINKDEAGTSIASGTVWTGTDWLGDFASISSGSPHCSNWTSGAAGTKGIDGDVTAVGLTWTQTVNVNASAPTCNTAKRLICVQQ